MESVTPNYGRTTTLLKIAGPKTLRLASTKLFYFDDEQPGYGENLQNKEKSERRRFEAKENYLLAQCDQSGADAKIVACLMPKGNVLRRLFDNGIKIHNYLGVTFPEQWEEIFPEVRDFRQLPIEEVKLHPRWGEFTKAVAASDDNPPPTRYYYHYKKVGHMSNYGSLGTTLQEAILLDSQGKVRLTRQQADTYTRGYHTLIPEIRNNFHKYIEHCYNTTGRLYTCQGYPIELTQRVFPHQYNKIYDKVPQATVAIITHLAVIKFQQFVEDNNLKWDLLTQTHDSYLCQAPGQLNAEGKPEGEVLECARLMKLFIEEQTMTNQYNETFTMKAESQCGKNWAPYKKDKNPLGLRTITC